MMRRNLPGWAITFLLAAYALLILLTFRHYGVTWDEPFQAEYGERILRWYGSGFRDTAAMSYMNLHWYGGFFEVLAQAASRVSPWGLMETRHLVNAAFGWVGVVLAFLLGRRLNGPWAGVVAALFVLLVPTYYGHAFTNSKDIPFAVLYLASLYALVVVVQSLPSPPWRLLVGLGVAIGLAMAVRIGGALLIGFTLAGFGLWILEARLGGTAAGQERSWTRSFGIVVLVAWIAMLPWWPWAQLNPVLHPLVALLTSERFPFTAPVLFGGELVPATELPRTYLLTWLAIRLPDFLLISLVISLFVLTHQCLKRGTAAVFRADVAVIVLAVVFPVAYAIARGSILYDGLRHFLFIIPPLCVLAACGMVQLARGDYRRAVLAVSLAPVAVGLGAVVVDMVRLHPYQYVYFNRMVGGGLHGAGASYETDYYGASYREGVEWLDANVGGLDGGRLGVASCSHPASTEYFLPADRFVYLGSLDLPVGPGPRDPDFFLATTRFDCHKRFRGEVVHTVARQGVPLLFIRAVSARARALVPAGPVLTPGSDPPELR